MSNPTPPSGMTLYYVRVFGDMPPESYLLMATSMQAATRLVVEGRDANAVTCSASTWQEAEPLVDKGQLPVPKLFSTGRPKCIDGPLAGQFLAASHPDSFIRERTYDQDGHHGTYKLDGAPHDSGYRWHPRDVK